MKCLLMKSWKQRVIAFTSVAAAGAICLGGVLADASSGAKQPLVGLVTMGDIGALMQHKGGHADNPLQEANAHPGVYTGVVLLASWEELEPVEGVLNTAPIDAGLDAIRAYNKRYPSTPLKAKLRIFSGWNTPDWVIAGSGGPITLTNKRGDFTVGRFWTAKYRKDWNGLQALLAARYDDNPLIGEVAVSSCTTTSAEPFVQIFTPENLRVLHAAGFTDTAFRACLMGAIDDYDSWKQTPIDYTLNPFRNTDSGVPVRDEDFTNRVAESFRRKLGSRAVIANHGLQSTLAPRQILLYAELKKLGPPLEFQTIDPRVDWEASIAKGLDYKATEIEIWNTRDAGGAANVSYDQLKKWSSELQGK